MQSFRRSSNFVKRIETVWSSNVRGHRSIHHQLDISLKNLPWQFAVIGLDDGLTCKSFQVRKVNHGILVTRPHGLLCRKLSTVCVSTTAASNANGLSDGSAVPAAASSPGAISGAISPSGNVLSVLRHYGQCYFELSKTRLSMLVVTTAGAGYVMGSGMAIDYYGLSCTCLGTFFVSAAANTFNQILEAENDSRMKRTCRRPLPAARITTEHAMAWATLTSIGGVGLLASQANMIAAGLGAINLILYTLVYTPLKQVHPINTWVGAVVGAVPPLLGWAAAAGEVNMGGWLLASALYFWQIPHFMAIAYLCRHDYTAGGFKMLSMEDASGQRTALAALRNCAYLVPLGYLTYKCGVTSAWFGMETALLSAGMGTTAALFYFRPSTDTARKLFRASLLYLPILLVVMLVHRRPNELNEDLHDNYITNDIGASAETVGDRTTSTNRSRPPVAIFSVAPFPFLPVPDYTSS